MEESLHVICLPSSDTAFATDARRLAARIPSHLSAADALAWYRRELQRRYPNATVREQDELARTDELHRVWYASNRPRQFRIDTSVRVPLPRADAYRVYVERVREWQTAVRLSPLSSPGGLVGTEYEASYEFLGHRFVGRFRVISANPARHVMMEAEGSGIGVWYVARFEDAPGGEGTLVTIQGDYDLPETLLGRIADRLGLERTIGRDIDRANDSYRRLCERLAITS